MAHKAKSKTAAPRAARTARSRSSSITGRRPTATKSPSCWRNAGCPTRSSRSTSRAATSSSRNSWRSRPTTACRRSSIRDGPGGRPISIFELGAILQYLGRKTGKFYPRERACARRGRSVAVLADGQSRPEGGRVPSLPPLRAGARQAHLRDRPLHQRMQPPLRRDGAKARRPRLSRRRLFDRRHGLRRMGEPLAAAGPGHRASSRTSSAGSSGCASVRPSTAACTSGSRRRPRSTCRIPTSARRCSVSVRSRFSRLRVSFLEKPVATFPGHAPASREAMPRWLALGQPARRVDDGKEQ